MITAKDYEELQTAAMTALGSIAEALVPVMQILVKVDGATSTITPISVPLTREQIEKMDGKEVVIPESEFRVGGIGIICLSKKCIQSISDRGVWSLFEYGEKYIAFATGTSDAISLCDGGESE